MGHSIVRTIFLALFHEFKLVYLSIIFLCVIIVLTSLTFYCLIVFLLYYLFILVQFILKCCHKYSSNLNKNCI